MSRRRPERPKLRTRFEPKETSGLEDPRALIFGGFLSVIGIVSLVTLPFANDKRGAALGAVAGLGLGGIVLYMWLDDMGWFNRDKK